LHFGHCFGHLSVIGDHVRPHRRHVRTGCGIRFRIVFGISTGGSFSIRFTTALAGKSRKFGTGHSGQNRRPQPSALAAASADGW